MVESKGPLRRVAVLGGGISGLAAAYTLARARQAGAPVEELLIEGKERLGGVICTEKVEGFVIEGGPDSFLAEKPEAAALCRELSLGEELLGSNDSERRTYILRHGRLVPLPDGLMFLVPTRIWPVLTTRLLPLRVKLAMAAEWFFPPPGNPRPDESVASFVRRHFGEAMLENIADPLLAGVYGGDSGALSVRSVLPRFWEMERKYGSLTRATLQAMRKRRKGRANAVAATNPEFPTAFGQAGDAAAGRLPLFMTLKGGLEDLTRKLAAHLEESRVHLRRRVALIESAAAAALRQAQGGPSTGSGSRAESRDERSGTATPGVPRWGDDSRTRRYLIRCEGDVTYHADAVILAMPARECSRLLASFDPRLSELLGSIPYSSSMTVSLAYDHGARDELPPGFGFLIPRRENRRMLACTFVHAKFHHRAPSGKALLRCFLGGTRDPDVLKLSDEEVVSLVRGELRDILKFSRQPWFYRIHRWPSSMAQYTVEHAERVQKIGAQLEKHPGLFVAGNAYSGIGISDCVRTGRGAAQRALGLANSRAE